MLASKMYPFPPPKVGAWDLKPVDEYTALVTHGARGQPVVLLAVPPGADVTGALAVFRMAAMAPQLLNALAELSYAIAPKPSAVGHLNPEQQVALEGAIEAMRQVLGALDDMPSWLDR